MPTLNSTYFHLHFSSNFNNPDLASKTTFKHRHKHKLCAYNNKSEQHITNITVRTVYSSRGHLLQSINVSPCLQVLDETQLLKWGQALNVSHFLFQHCVLAFSSMKSFFSPVINCTVTLTHTPFRFPAFFPSSVDIRQSSGPLSLSRHPSNLPTWVKL